MSTTYITHPEMKAINLLSRAGELTSEELSKPDIGTKAANRIIALAEEIKLAYGKLMSDTDNNEILLHAAMELVLRTLHEANTISARTELAKKIISIAKQFNYNNLRIDLNKQNNITIETDWF